MSHIELYCSTKDEDNIQMRYLVFYCRYLGLFNVTVWIVLIALSIDDWLIDVDRTARQVSCVMYSKRSGRWSSVVWVRCDVVVIIADSPADDTRDLWRSQTNFLYTICHPSLQLNCGMNGNRVLNVEIVEGALSFRHFKILLQLGWFI